MSFGISAGNKHCTVIPHTTFSILLIFIFLLCNSVFAEGKKPQVSVEQNQPDEKIIEIDWKTGKVTLPESIIENDIVIIKIMPGFNFIKYSLSYEIKEEKIEIY
ncbi:MAG: hypothetical protein JW737_04695, partial [Acidobacteria bacterium]|nr:hypothetical protein [Acidobacteriota bacterium]